MSAILLPVSAAGFQMTQLRSVTPVHYALFEPAEADLVAAALAVIDAHFLPGHLGVHAAISYIRRGAYRSISEVIVRGPPGAWCCVPPSTLSVYDTPALMPEMEIWLTSGTAR